MAVVSAILAAAGRSTRMGRPKQLLPWGGTTLIEFQIQSLLDAGVDDVVVVLGHNPDAITSHIKDKGVKCVINPHYKQGKTTSIKAGLRCINADTQAILYLAVDQPRTKDIISQVLKDHFEKKALITSPRYEGHGGHPLIFDASLRRELEAITEEKQGLREVFQAHRENVNELSIDDPMIRLDLNTPEIYQEAKAKYGV